MYSNAPKPFYFCERQMHSYILVQYLNLGRRHPFRFGVNCYIVMRSFFISIHSMGSNILALVTDTESQHILILEWKQILYATSPKKIPILIFDVSQQ